MKTERQRTEESKHQRRLDLAVQVRNFEIELFWKRSLFFWGFIASAFIGYAALRNLKSDLSIVIACFGMICSFSWTLVNRGSKYWQEAWEQKVGRFEISVTGRLFVVEEPIEKKLFWLRARKYSVSKLAIALSDYVFLLWFALVIGEGARIFFPGLDIARLKQYGLMMFVVFSLSYIALLAVFGRKSKSADGNGS